jgi:drug/metabolite transporter (DMT)-like permease
MCGESTVTSSARGQPAVTEGALGPLALADAFNSSMVSRRKVLLVLAVVQLFFASLAVAGKIALREMGSTALVLARVGGAALIFFVLHRLTTNEKIRERRDYLLLALFSVLGVSLNQLLYLAGLERTTATMAQMFIVAGPAVTLGLGILRGSEKGTPLKWVGIILAAGGALTLVATVPAGNRLGNMLILVNVVIYSMYLVLARGIVQRYHPLTVITWIFGFGALALIPIGAVPLMRVLPTLSTDAWLAIAWIIALPTVAAYYLNVWALIHVESSTVSTFVYLQPVLTALMAAAILGERPSARIIPSALLIAAGVAVAIREQRVREKGPSPADQSMVEV